MMIKQLLFLLMSLGLLWSGQVRAQKPEMSRPGHQVWYNVVSACSETQGMVMSDCHATSATFPIGVEARQAALASQQWLFVEADDDGRLVYLVNRNSGRVLQPVSEATDLYRIVQLTGSADEGKGFVLTGLGRGQYAFVGAESDGHLRGLVTAKQGQVMGDAALEQGSPYAWTFQKIEVTDGAEWTSAGKRPLVYVKNGRIEVSGGVPYRVVRADGAEVPCGSKLSPGVYLVTVAGQTTKVLNFDM